LFGLVVTVTNSLIYTFSLRSRAFFSSQEISSFYGNWAATAGLKSSSKKTSELWINSEITPHINLYNVGTEIVKLLAYLGCVVMVHVGALQDGKAQIKEAYGTCVESHPLWKNKNILMNTKFHIFSSNVKLVLLYRCKTWKVTIQITIKLQSLLIDVCEQ